jgi:hypothetical protein
MLTSIILLRTPKYCCLSSIPVTIRHTFRNPKQRLPRCNPVRRFFREGGHLTQIRSVHELAKHAKSSRSVCCDSGPRIKLSESLRLGKNRTKSSVDSSMTRATSPEMERATAYPRPNTKYGGIRNKSQRILHKEEHRAKRPASHTATMANSLTPTPRQK